MGEASQLPEGDGLVPGWLRGYRHTLKKRAIRCCPRGALSLPPVAAAPLPLPPALPCAGGHLALPPAAEASP